VKTIDAFTEAVRGERFDEVWLDHDLQEVPGNTVTERRQVRVLTGCDAAKLLVRLPVEKRPGEVIIHSWNSPGARVMDKLLYDAGIKVTKQPFRLLE
jgi:hypothetical protein